MQFEGAHSSRLFDFGLWVLGFLGVDVLELRAYGLRFRAFGFRFRVWTRGRILVATESEASNGKMALAPPDLRLSLECVCVFGGFVWALFRVRPGFA